MGLDEMILKGLARLEQYENISSIPRTNFAGEAEYLDLIEGLVASSKVDALIMIHPEFTFSYPGNMLESQYRPSKETYIYNLEMTISYAVRLGIPIFAVPDKKEYMETISRSMRNMWTELDIPYNQTGCILESISSQINVNIENIQAALGGTFWDDCVAEFGSKGFRIYHGPRDEAKKIENPAFYARNLKLISRVMSLD